MVKNLNKFPEPMDRFPRMLVCSIADSNSSNYDPGLTLTYFTAKSIFCNLGFSMGKRENNGFSETIAACELEVGRCRQLIDLMN